METDMEKFTRQQFLDRLQNNWLDYAGRFHRLAPADQKAFLVKQGYANLAGLLGHIVAWWQAGVEVVQKMRSDPAFANPDYDVDSFNARAVARFGGLDEAEVVRTYEAQRQTMIDLVNGLTADELDSERINTRLYYEIIMHWDEHTLPG
jgi:hypothetical protein